MKNLIAFIRVIHRLDFLFRQLWRVVNEAETRPSKRVVNMEDTLLHSRVSAIIASNPELLNPALVQNPSSFGKLKLPCEKWRLRRFSNPSNRCGFCLILIVGKLLQIFRRSLKLLYFDSFQEIDVTFGKRKFVVQVFCFLQCRTTNRASVLQK